ncbi:MAG: UbiA family prenyltransferase [Flavobacteriales bacterium]|nr:UbiA family prenyltransferase [Flavobacteriales bacterium]
MKYLRFARPLYWLPTISSSISGWLSTNPTFDWSLVVLLVVMVGPGLSGFAEAFNGLQDEDFDRESKQYKFFGISLAGGTGQLSKREILRNNAAWFILVLTGTSILISLYFGACTTLLCLTALSVGYLYSSSTVKLNRSEWFRQALLFLGYGPIAFFIGVSTGISDWNYLSHDQVFFSVMSGVMVVSVGVTSDVLDYTDNIKSGKRNIVTLYGPKMSLTVSTIISWLVLAITFAYSEAKVNLHQREVVLLLIVFLMFVRTKLLMNFQNPPVIIRSHLISIGIEILFPFVMVFNA